MPPGQHTQQVHATRICHQDSIHHKYIQVCITRTTYTTSILQVYTTRTECTPPVYTTHKRHQESMCTTSRHQIRVQYSQVQNWHATNTDTPEVQHTPQLSALYTTSTAHTHHKHRTHHKYSMHHNRTIYKYGTHHALIQNMPQAQHAPQAQCRLSMHYTSRVVTVYK